MADWITTARAKEHLGIATSDTTLDAKLATLVTAASKLLDGFIGHSIHQATYTEYYDGDATNELLLNNYPVVSITSIHDDLDRAFGSDKLIAATDYVFDSNENENVGFVRLFKTQSVFQTGVQNVKVVYVAGYTTAPEDAQLACAMLVAWLLNRAGTEGQTAASLGGKSETYESDIPLYIRRLVHRYKKFSF